MIDAVLLTDPAEWAALLDERCGADAELRREVEAFLARLPAARSFLGAPPARLAAAALAEAREVDSDARTEGRRIGSYRIVREIGRGGMSRVFLAERADGQFEQQVALKLLRPGLDSELDLERIRAERQILAALSHPNIARLFDGGITDGGQPYLVLEHVDGQPIDDWCDARSLSIGDRLELFLGVAEATQYAHRNLIVHRDLKPSNILVDREGRVKLLDFGLARMLDPMASGSSLRDRTQQRWLTPDYAAPEQILGGPISTLTDVYQLGAVLYRLLTGSRPFGAASAGLHELEAAVLTEDPDPPSVAVATTHAERRNALRGDLDAIVLKALRKEPEERFPSAEAMAEDVRRHLAMQPVSARRQTTWYRTRRLVRRRRRETVAGAAVTLSLLIAAAVSLSEGRRAAAERDRAEAASRHSAGVTAFVLGLFEVSDPAESGGGALTAAELVRRGVARAERLRDSPAEHASMLEITSRLYASLGRHSDADSVLERALALRRLGGEGDGLEVASTLEQVADSKRRLGRYAAADSLARRALAIRQRLLAAEDPSVATTLHQLGLLAVYRGDMIGAEGYHRRALALRQAALGAADSLTGQSHLYVGTVLARRGLGAAAEREFRHALAILERTRGRNHGEVADAVLQIAYQIGDDPARRAEAETLFRRAIEIRRRFYGEGHPAVGYALLDLAGFLGAAGDHAAAVPLARTYIEMVRRAYGAEHPVVATATNQLAKTLWRAGQVEEAEALLRQALAMERRLRGGAHVSVAGHEFDLGRLLMERGDFPAAEQMLRSAIRIRAQSLGGDDPVTAYARGLLGSILTRSGDYAAADTLLRGAIRTIERQVAPDHPDVRELHRWVAELDSARAARSGVRRGTR